MGPKQGHNALSKHRDESGNLRVAGAPGCGTTLGGLCRADKHTHSGQQVRQDNANDGYTILQTARWGAQQEEPGRET